MITFQEAIRTQLGIGVEENAQQFITLFKPERLNKQDFFTKSGAYCSKLSFVSSGILRIYAESDGREITQWLSTPGYFVTELPSFFFNQPSRWNIQALTEVKLLSIDKETYRTLCKDFPKWNLVEKIFMAKCFTMLEDRVFSHLSMSAEQRYASYFEQNAPLFNKVPLQYIASVIGVSPETLSRIRKKRSETS